MKLRNKLLMLMFFIFLATIGTGTAAETVKVASIYAHTGEAAVGNLITATGIRFAVSELNRRGGLLGRQVEIIEYDNGSKALNSKLSAVKAVEEKVIAVFGANWSSHSLAMAPVLQKARIPMISTFSTNPDVTKVGDYIFRVCFIDSFQGRVVANFAFHDLEARTAAVMVNASRRYSEGLADFFRSHFMKSGGDIVFETNYIQGETNYIPLIKDVIASNPDVLFVPGAIVDSGMIIKQVRDEGYTKPILGGDGWGVDMIELAGSALEDTYYSGHWDEGSDNPLSRQFLKEYVKNYNEKDKDGAALAWDAVFILADAVRRAGTFKTEKIRSELSKTSNFKGVTGNISFNHIGDPIKSAVILKIVDGRPVFVKNVDP